MIEYGYINEGGYLTSKHIEEYTEQYRDGDQVKQRLITVEMQIEKLAALGWKPVAPIDEDRLNCAEGYFVRLVPFDNGTDINYRYVTVFDTQKVRRKIQSLKDRLAKDDYKIIKCYEAFLLGQPLPYDIQQVHDERQSFRNEINELEATIE